MNRYGMQLKAAPLLMALAVANAYAQSAAPEAPAAAVAGTEEKPAEAAAAQPAESGVKLQEVVVTATRRSANLQKVAATVNVLTAESVSQLNITSVSDMQGLVPGMTMVRSAGTVPFLRGVGTNNSGFTTETAVGMYIDGLYLANSAAGLFGFNNIERIEVLKGPQGTLYGRNTTGGLINVVTRDPEAKMHADASVSYDNYSKKTVNFYGSTPLSDTLAMNIAVIGSDQSEGWGKNIVTGNENLKGKEGGTQVKLVWKPNAGTKVSLRAFYDYLNTDQGVAIGILPGTVAIDGTGYLGEYRTATRTDPYVISHQFNSALKVEHDLGPVNLLSITGYQHNKSPLRATQNAIPGQPVLGRAAIESLLVGENKTFSQELQVSSKPSNSPLDWIGGFFYYDDVTTLLSDVWSACVNGVCAPAPLPTRTTARPTTKSASLYADGSYTLRPGTRLSLGIRYTQDKKALTGLNEPLPGLPNSPKALPPGSLLRPGDPYPGNPNGIATEATFSKTTFRAALSQDLSARAQVYASFNRGFKAGGYNPGSFSNPVSRPETLDAIEVGVKSELFERRLRLNVSVFNYDYQDIQLRSTAPPAPVGGSILTNAAGARVNGLDAEIKFAATENLRINGAFEFLDAKFTSFPGGACSTARPIAGAVLGGAVTVPCDLAGHQLINSPKYSYTLGFVYAVDIPYGSLSLAANDSYKSSYAFSTDGAPFQKAYHNISGSLTWRSPDERYDVQVFGKNLGGAYYYATAQGPAVGSYVYSPGAPRTFGVTLGYHY
ncbi:MAG: TonB-dependent receptor [Pseudomonadota bacterium]